MKKLLIPIAALLVCLSCTKDDPEILNVVINELMPVNNYTVMDQDNEFDDWIELYNKSTNTIDLTGCYLSDSKKNLRMWKFPDGTSISGHSYLVIWADKDTTQEGYHANFKLSNDGEKIYFCNGQGRIADEVEYGANTAEKSYARIPNGTGNFAWTTPTVNAVNK